MIKFLPNTRHVAYGTKKISLKTGDKFSKNGFTIDNATNALWIQKSIDFHKKSNHHYDSNVIMNVLELDYEYKVLNIQKFR